jgi:hypothetical protein
MGKRDQYPAGIELQRPRGHIVQFLKTTNEENDRHDYKNIICFAVPLRPAGSNSTGMRQ